jgi:bleomycin hydrolase
MVPNNDSVKVSRLVNLKRAFNSNQTNKLIQNSLCSNSLQMITEDREYMQSRDNEFSHTLEPELVVSNQGLSGRCWLFAVLNVMRHELVRKFNLTHDFELSESYLCFYEKLEKCNFFLTKISKMNTLDENDRYTRSILMSGCVDGGLWITCANLIKKYGIIPKSCYRESINSYATDDMNEILNGKLKEFALQLTSEKNHKKRAGMKQNMMAEIYNILCKMLGTPPNPSEKFQWSFTLYQDLTGQIEREKKRKKSGNYENLQLKTTFELTPLEFYDQFIVNKLDDYLKFGNDPRNPYFQYYEGVDDDVIVEGSRNGFFNVPMEIMSQLASASIMDNTPVEFDCDVGKYLNPAEELMDNKCYNYSLVFGDNFDKMTKEQGLKCMDSYANHAMVIVGVDVDNEGNTLKWKIENSWGRHEGANSTGYYTMSNSWFDRYVYNVVIQDKYVSEELMAQYQTALQNPVTLPAYDIMS